MAATPTTPRSVYAGRLREFPDLALADQAAWQHHGRWSDLFRQRIGHAFSGRVIFEIGCFDAEFLARIAASHPDTAFVGLDWKCKAIYDGAQRLADMGLRNVMLLRGRGQDAMRIFGPGEVDEVWVFHPDPCDREIELKNRLIGEPFLRDVHQILRNSTSLLALKTDHPGYYQWVLGLLGLPEPAWFQPAREQAITRSAKHSGSAIPLPRVRACDVMPSDRIPQRSDDIGKWFDVAMNSADYWHDPAAIAQTADRCFAGETTLFEKRFIKKGLPIYYLELQKKGPMKG